MPTSAGTLEMALLPMTPGKTAAAETAVTKATAGTPTTHETPANRSDASNNGEASNKH